MKQYVYCLFLWTPDDDCIYYHSWRNNVIIVFWILSSEYLLVCLATWIIHVCDQTHMRMRHVTRIDMHNGTLVLNIVSCHTYEWVILHSCWILCHVTHMNTHMNESYCSCWILCHVTHMNESYCTHAEYCVKSHAWMSHVALVVEVWISEYLQYDMSDNICMWKRDFDTHNSMIYWRKTFRSVFWNVCVCADVC